MAVTWSLHTRSCGLSCSSTSSASSFLSRNVSRYADQLSQVRRIGSGSRSRQGGVAVVASSKSMDSFSTISTEEKGVRAEGSQLPLREIPGGHGIPYLSPWMNRWRFLFFEDGAPTYWENRLAKHESTVFRTNIMPGWPWTDSRCIVFLDQKSFSTVFDYDKVDKYKAFTGSIMPSTAYNGGFEMCAYLDTSDKKHAQLKAYCFDVLKLAAPKWAAEFHTSIASAFLRWEQQLSEKQPALIPPLVADFMFRFLINALTSANLDDPKIPVGEKPLVSKLQMWMLFQLIPVMKTRALPWVLEELLHTAPIPFKLSEGGYNQMVAFLQKYAGETLALATSHGVSPEEAVHNLIFFTILNAHGGYCRMLPTILREVGQLPDLQSDLRAEVRAAVEANGGKLTMKAVMTDMPLVASTVFESLRIDPPVPFQHARAKKDFVVESHDAKYQIKKGELMGGLNYFASRDPKVFKNDPDKFVATRFMGPEGEKLLHYLVWSNGRQTDESSVDTKQCAGKDIVPLTGRLMVAEIFMRYDSFTIESSKNPSKMAFTTLQRRTDL